MQSKDGVNLKSLRGGGERNRHFMHVGRYSIHGHQLHFKNQLCIRWNSDGTGIKEIFAYHQQLKLMPKCVNTKPLLSKPEYHVTFQMKRKGYLESGTPFFP